MQSLTNEACGNDYTPAAELADVWNGRGGWFAVKANAAVYKLEYGDAPGNWSDEAQLDPGAFLNLPDDCVGIAARNATPGAVAVVSAAIAEGDEPVPSIAALGTPTSLFVPSEVSSRTTSGTAGTIEPLGFGDLTVAAVVIRANPTNVGNVYLGGSDVGPADGYILSPGDALGIDTNSVHTIYMTVDHTGDGVSWLMSTG